MRTAGVLLWAALLPTGALAGTLYKCVGADGVTNYSATPRSGENCLAIATYAPARASAAFGIGPPTILRECRDAPTGGIASPSLRARECTRIRCKEPPYLQRIRAYALSQEQSEMDAEDALTCLARQESDKKGRTP